MTGMSDGSAPARPAPRPAQYADVLGLPLLHAGKVRELYAWTDPTDSEAEERLLMIATDAISAFDFVLANPIPDKGAILTQLSAWWFDQVAGIVDNHVISYDVPAAVSGRGVICERLEMVPYECVARGYLTGSGWAEYQQTQTVCGIALPAGLVDGSRLPEPIFTPATKAELGEHDENVLYDVVEADLGPDLAGRVRALTLAVYARAEEVARERGIILADTKLEFGRRPDGTVVLADEVLTPDSSRFWEAATWVPGERLDSFDKQFVRNWLLRESGWDRAAGDAPPSLPAEVVDATRARYADAYERLTGAPFVPSEASSHAR